MTPDGSRTAAELLEDERIGMPTTTSPEGTPTSRPMSDVVLIRVAVASAGRT